ncbi:MAG: preprotein translocase subunit SecG [Candidatus Caenarcaniphilales bacterium]|nr:preprotein translocase subunit SecG [Candidatus Caenarcaniphilales bacterium]
MLIFFQLFQIFTAVLTVTLVLMHSAKGEGIGSIGSSSQMFSTSSELEKGLNIVTWISGLSFLICSACLSWGLIK